MCGIAGFCDFRKKSTQDELRQMTDVLWHRGPDSSGYEFYPLNNAHIGLGHRRLSIIDLSEKAAQPLKDESGGYVITFNGEIYNYKEIRAELEREGYKFFSSSDTEVLLKAFIRWGVDAVHKLIGMFAFVIYDKTNEKLYLFRDRAGVKPLHYYYKDGLFLFSSELKSFCQHPAFDKKISKEALPLYFKFGYVPTPLTIFENTHKVKPGHYMIFDTGSGTLAEKKYWDVYDYYNRPTLDISEQDAIEQMEALLKSATMYRMVSDVPVGVFLSSGYDSTAVASILQANSTERIRTFTIGFTEKRYNEANEAKAIANYIGTDHTEYYCSENDAKEMIKKLPLYYDEPFVDTSAIPTMLVSKLAREKVTVALSADGGDETFSGYRHVESRIRLHRRIARTPLWARNLIIKISDLMHKPTRSYNGYNRYIMVLINQLWKLNNRLASDEIINIILQGKIANYRIYRLLNSLPNPEKTNFSNFSNLRKDIDDINKCLAIDYQNNMVDDMLTKVDRATMSASLEGREPLLDHRIVEFAARLPVPYKCKNGVRKRILRNIVHKYVPENMMDRPKKGFGVPIYKWLREDLSQLIFYYLDESKLNEHHLFNTSYVLYLRDRYMKDGSEYGMVWSILVFQMWYQRWISGETHILE